MKVNLNSIRQSLVLNSFEVYSQIKLFGIIMSINYPLYFFLFDFNYSPNIIISLVLRSFASLLCMSLIFIDYRKVNLSKSLYWYFTIGYCLPFFFTFMSLLNNLSPIWLMNCISAVFFMMLILNFRSFIFILILGVSLGLTCYRFLSYTLEPLDLKAHNVNLLNIASTIFAALIIGGLFTRNNFIRHLERLNILKALGGAIAHELRTPLASLDMRRVGLSAQIPKLLEAYKLAKEYGLPVQELRTKDIRTLEETAKSIENLINESLLMIDMLLIKLKDPSQAIKKDLYSIKEIVENAIGKYPLHNSQRSLIKVNLISNFNFYSNESMFLHVIFNLLKNALYYIKQEDKGEIIITTEKSSKYNILYFKDTAKGIPADILPNLFQKFYTKSEHGTGLGLAFCKLVMEEIGGNISCRSVYGKFTEFVLTFPIPKNT